jgi:hypothetical protein
MKRANAVDNGTSSSSGRPCIKALADPVQLLAQSIYPLVKHTLAADQHPQGGINGVKAPKHSRLEFISCHPSTFTNATPAAKKTAPAVMPLSIKAHGASLIA